MNYGDEQITQLFFIKQCRNIGLSIEEIKILQSHFENPPSECGEVNQLIASALKKVREQLKLLHETELRLNHLFGLCNQSGASHECGIMNELRVSNSID